jgi:hypothetical protein
MKIVLTGISATPYAREYISNAAKTLRECGHQVFVPHEGSWQQVDKPAETDRFDFQATYQALHDADLLMAILDGYTVDDSVAAQLGIFYAHAREGKQPRRILGILHDTRVAGWDWTGGDKALAPMIRQMIVSLGKVYPNFRQALAALDAEPESVKA